MRLIGIQALLLLIKRPVEAIASASGIGNALGFNDAGVVAHASGIGGASANSLTIGTWQAIASAYGLGNALGVGAALSHQGAAVAAGGGGGSADGHAMVVDSASASASGNGIASAIGQIVAIAGAGSAAGTGAALAVGAVRQDARATQVYIEIISNDIPTVRETQAYIEFIISPYAAGVGSASGTGVANGAS